MEASEIDPPTIVEAVEAPSAWVNEDRALVDPPTIVEAVEAPAAEDAVADAVDAPTSVEAVEDPAAAVAVAEAVEDPVRVEAVEAPSAEDAVAWAVDAPVSVEVVDAPSAEVKEEDVPDENPILICLDSGENICQGRWYSETTSACDASKWGLTTKLRSLPAPISDAPFLEKK